MIGQLSVIGLGIASFAIIAMVGISVVSQFGDTMGGSVNDTATTILGHFDTLVGWLPIIIVVLLGGLAMAYFGGRNKVY